MQVKNTNHILLTFLFCVTFIVAFFSLFLSVFFFLSFFFPLFSFSLSFFLCFLSFSSLGNLHSIALSVLFSRTCTGAKSGRWTKCSWFVGRWMSHKISLVKLLQTYFIQLAERWLRLQQNRFRYIHPHVTFDLPSVSYLLHMVVWLPSEILVETMQLSCSL